MNDQCVSYELVNKQDIIFQLVKSGNEKLYHLLEEDKNLINSQDKDGNSILHWAVFLNNIYLVCYLLENSANINIKSNIKQTPLHWAICSNNIFMIYLLKKYGCNLFETDNKGYNCLIISIQYNHILCFFYLLYLNFSITHKDFNNCSVVEWSAYNNNLFFLRLFSIFLINPYPLNINKPSFILYKAIIGNAYEAVIYLILNNHQNIYDVATDDDKTIVEFVREHQSNVDPRIYQFIMHTKIQKMSKKNKKNRKMMTDNLYEPNGKIGNYIIKKNKRMSFLFNIYSKYKENPYLLVYPLLVVMMYLYLNLAYFFYIRVKLYHKCIFFDVLYPSLFLIYYYVVSSNPGYLENPKRERHLMGNDEIGKNNSANKRENEEESINEHDRHDEHDVRDDYKNENGNYHQKKNNDNKVEQNLTFEYIIKNVNKEIMIFEKKNKICEFTKEIKNENVFKLKEKLDIKWNLEQFKIQSFDINMLCPTCFLLKNLRTKHCRFCNRCIEIHDHHCVFTLNCMAINNSRVFLLWVLSNILFSFYNIYLYIRLAFRLSLDYHSLLFYIIFIALILFILLIYFMGNIFLRSFFNILENITTNEKFKMYSSKTFFLYELKIDEYNQPFVVRKFKNPFDKGKLFNFWHFLTKSKKNLMKKNQKFIEIDKNIKSEVVKSFVENLNEKLREFYRTE